MNSAKNISIDNYILSYRAIFLPSLYIGFIFKLVQIKKNKTREIIILGQ